MSRLIMSFADNVPAQSSGLFHVDPAAAAACAAADVAVLVGVLVFSSVLQLARSEHTDRFSIRVAEMWDQSGKIVLLVEILVYLAAISGCIGLVSMTIKAEVIGIISLALSLLTIILFAAVCALSIRWFWRRGQSDE